MQAFSTRLTCNMGEDLPCFRGIGSICLLRIDRLANFTGTHGLERARYLGNIFNAPDPEPHFTSGWHKRYSLELRCSPATFECVQRLDELFLCFIINHLSGGYF